jgi:hypothetical protein
MQFQEALKFGLEIIKLNRSIYRYVASVPEAFTQALIITALAGVAAWLTPTGFSFFGLLFKPIGAIISLFIYTAIIHFIANLMGFTGDFMGLFRVLGIGRLIGWVAIVPFVGGLVSFAWSVVISVVALEELYGMDRTKSILCLLIPVIVFLVLMIISTMLAGVATLGLFFF